MIFHFIPLCCCHGDTLPIWNLSCKCTLVKTPLETWLRPHMARKSGFSEFKFQNSNYAKQISLVPIVGFLFTWCLNLMNAVKVLRTEAKTRRFESCVVRQNGFVLSKPAFLTVFTFSTHSLFPLCCHLCVYDYSVLVPHTTPGRDYTAGVEDVQTEQQRPVGSLHSSQLHVMYYLTAVSVGSY